MLFCSELIAQVNFEELVRAKEIAGDQVFNTKSEQEFHQRLQMQDREYKAYSEQLKQEKEARKKPPQFPTIDLNSGGTKTCKKMFGNVLEDEPLPAGTVIQVDGIACPPGWY